MNKNHKFQSTGLEFSKAEDGSLVSLFDILKEIPNPEQVFWSIQLLDIEGFNGNLDLLKRIKSACTQSIGYEIEWEDLFGFFKGVESFNWLILIGVRDKQDFKNYQSDLERYEKVNYDIEVFDGYLWDVFSLDPKFIDRLKEKFKDATVLSPDETADWQRY